jgi:hypothetical protein
VCGAALDYDIQFEDEPAAILTLMPTKDYQWDDGDPPGASELA